MKCGIQFIWSIYKSRIKVEDKEKQILRGRERESERTLSDLVIPSVWIIFCMLVRPLRFVLLFDYLKEVLVLDQFIELIKYTHHEMRLNQMKKAETLLRAYATIIIENWRYYELFALFIYAP